MYTIFYQKTFLARSLNEWEAGHSQVWLLRDRLHGHCLLLSLDDTSPVLWHTTLFFPSVLIHCCSPGPIGDHWGVALFVLCFGAAHSLVSFHGVLMSVSSTPSVPTWELTWGVPHDVGAAMEIRGSEARHRCQAAQGAWGWWLSICCS